MSNDAHRTAVDALQLAGALHSAQVAPDGLLRDSKSICNVYNVHPPFGGQEVTDRLEASRRLRVMDGGAHYRLRIAQRANVTGTPSYALTECL